MLDGSGKFLIPGLWDMHAHAVTFGPTSLPLYLANGVTGIRDMGAERFADAKAWRDRIAAGALEGPRMRIASPVVENARWLAAVRAMNDRAGTPWTLHERVAPQSPAEAVPWVDSLAALGPDHIKVRNWPAPRSAARWWNARVSADFPCLPTATSRFRDPAFARSNITCGRRSAQTKHAPPYGANSPRTASPWCQRW